MTASDEAFERAYRDHYWQVVAYAARRADPDAARDIAQEVFAVAWRRRAELPAEPLPWLYGIAAGVLANQARSRRRRERLVAKLAVVPDAPGRGDGAAPDVAPEPADPADSSALRALATLAEPDREVLRLAAWEDLPPAAIARVLDCTPNTAAARLSRAKKRYRAAYADLTFGGAHVRPHA